ncbi:protein GAMETE EXPRESSED 2-like isoform X4 [Phalaenopsis equestris]|uniref:protein GAMETE EXPRESSED 2-like isoform X4 n=1 Tax=Phalaenopsis equestris TaxID=78828 RepID=UPI0009E32706|nr:protein GAMETE EXPRESSED 2-like isoform X4 [Phalaenopsis equestris]
MLWIYYSLTLHYFSIFTGPLNITSSIAKWKYDINSLQIFSKLQIFVHQNDRFGNLVPGFYPFDAQVVQKATGLSVPVGDLSFQEVDYGIQLVSFAVSEPGDFMITIFNSKLNESIYSLPYTVFVGNCHGLNSFANGSGLISSVAGRLSWFTVYLEDAYTNPSPVEAEQLYVEIRSRNFNIMIRPIIHPLKSFNGTYRGPVSTPTDILMGTSGFVHSTTSKGNRTFIGKYTVQASEFGITYIPEKSGDYEIRLSCGNIPLNDAISYSMKVLPGKYFPEANNDSVSVWEDESVVFDVLFNDYASDGQASLSEFSKPLHGSLLLVGKLFRYTPFKGYFGNDSFLYNITDSNNNVAIGAAFISVLCKPPQFVSLPLRLNVTEDVLSPQFGGFPGFEIRYSDKMENISLTISAKFGSVYLAPSQIGIFEPVGGMLSVRRGGRAGKDLVLTGPIEVVNSALQLIQYLSNENFYGDDTISLYATNKNGLLDSHVPVFVKPINDPPKIHVPKFITLVGKEASDGFQIFDKQRDIFEFSISDSDIFHYTGNKSHLVVMFSVEVNDGLLSTTLPVHLIKTSELKIKSSNQWQPLQTFVTIDNQFVIKGRGVRFQGTIRDCNNAMQRLFFQGTNLDALLTITVNDLGNYGCYLDCTDIISFPLSVEVSVSLLKRRPLTSTTAFLLGSAIFFEIATLFLLGSILLFFIFKCMVALHTERNNGDNPRQELTENHNEKIDILPFQNAMNLNRTSTGSLSTPLNFSRRSSKFCRRSGRRIRPKQSEMPLSVSCASNNLKVSSANIELQTKPQSD